MNPHILLIEPNLLAQRAEKNILAQQGIKVDTATNAEMILEKVMVNKYDAIIVDLELQEDLTGFDLIHSVRNLTNIEIPAIILSSYSLNDKIHIQRAKELKINWYIIRPITVEVAILLTNWIRGKCKNSFFVTSSF